MKPTSSDTRTQLNELIESLRKEENVETLHRTERDKQIIAAYQNGKTLRQVGKQFGLSGQGVANVLKRVGIIARPRGTAPHSENNYPDDLIAKVITAYKSGMTMQHVADEVGMSYHVVRAILVKANVPRRTAGSWSSPVQLTEKFRAAMREEVAAAFSQLVDELHALKALIEGLVITPNVQQSQPTTPPTITQPAIASTQLASASRSPERPIPSGEAKYDPRFVAYGWKPRQLVRFARKIGMRADIRRGTGEISFAYPGLPVIQMDRRRKDCSRQAVMLVRKVLELKGMTIPKNGNDKGADVAPVPEHRDAAVVR